MINPMAGLGDVMQHGSDNKQVRPGYFAAVRGSPNSRFYEMPIHCEQVYWVVLRRTAGVFPWRDESGRETFLIQSLPDR